MAIMVNTELQIDLVTIIASMGQSELEAAVYAIDEQAHSCDFTKRIVTNLLQTLEYDCRSDDGHYGLVDIIQSMSVGRRAT